MSEEEYQMPTKPGLTRLEHEELGAKLKQLRDEVLRISSQLERLTRKRLLGHALLPIEDVTGPSWSFEAGSWTSGITYD
jgi:hypothetical protein